MTLQPAGTQVGYTVTYLEMEQRPSWGYPHTPPGPPPSLLKAVAPPTWYFLSLYDAVGRDYAWEDYHSMEIEALRGWLNDPDVALYTLLSEGWPKGFFTLEKSSDNSAEIAQFGLVPEAVGRGLGGFLLKTAILTAWDIPGTRRLRVNTCTLDHPRALQMYQKHGFTPVRREDKTRILTRDRDLSRIPE